MAKQLIVSNLYNTAAILEKDEVQKFIVVDDDYQVGDIYLGIVNKIFQSLNAAFIDLQINKKSGFIHAHDSGRLKRKSSINNITQMLTINQKVLVQVIKESTSHKGPKLTANITLSGHYIVLMPFNHTVCISRNIPSLRQRSILKALAILFKPCKMGLLFREHSAGISEDILFQELQSLINQWGFVQKCVITGISPSLIYRNDNITRKVLEDVYDPAVKNITIASKTDLYSPNKYDENSIDNHLSLNILKNLECHASVSDLFFKITESLENYIQLPLGGYIQIEISEALTTIDVNSGSFNNASNPRETVLTTNCLAATEIGYQLLKKNITGIIVIDFIDMRKKKDQLYLLKHFSLVLQKDYTRPQIIQLSELGLVEIVRQRIGKSLDELFNTYLAWCNQLLYPNKQNAIRFKKLYSYSDSAVNKLRPFSVAITKNYTFFKKVFSSFYYMIYKRKFVYSYIVITRYYKLRSTAVIYSVKSPYSLSTLSSHTNVVNIV